jgi:mono/diheme cytochrome c family protein
MNPSKDVRAARARPLAAVATLLALTSIGNALVAGCGGKSQESSSQSATPSATAAPPASTTPSASTGQAPAGDLGAKVYTERCVLCHGPNGKGDGPAAAGLNPKPRNHTDGSYMNSRTDEQLLQVIRNGKGAMPAWGKVLSEEEIQAVLKHVRSLAQPPYHGS